MAKVKICTPADRSFYPPSLWRTGGLAPHSSGGPAHQVVKSVGLTLLFSEMEPHDMLALGYPALKPSGKFMRDPKKMIHYDDCGHEDFRLEDEVKDFIKRARNWTIGTHRRKAG